LCAHIGKHVCQLFHVSQENLVSGGDCPLNGVRCVMYCSSREKARRPLPLHGHSLSRLRHIRPDCPGAKKKPPEGGF